MNESIQLTLKNLPDSPGIYMMKNARGEIIYVGKAVSLRNRVRQYFHESTQRLGGKTARMVLDIVSIDYVMVLDEAEALMLENNLIKRHKPRYNIRLKDSKAYPYIRINMKEKFPRAEITRLHKKNDGARYFGPYMSAGALRQTMDAIQKVFPLRTCTKDIDKAIERGERSCLNAQIGRCAAPCIGRISSGEYKKIAREVCNFLSGGHEEIASRLRKEMEAAADALEFEKAAALRDQLMSVLSINGEGQAAESTVISNADVIGVYTDGDEASIALLLMRNGKLIGTENFLMQGSEEETPRDIADGFIKQFYMGNTVIPKEIILRDLPPDAEVFTEVLHRENGGKVELIVPQRGERRRLLEIAERNAQEKLSRERIQRQRQWERTGGAVKALAEILNIPPPKRIECYDISNIQGTDSVASMVVFTDGKADKNQYRRFRIKTVEGPNDFESMKEVLYRRFQHGLEERAALDEQGLDYSKGSFSLFPDLVLIDGGDIQLEFAMNSMKELGVGDIPAIGLAKRFEHIILPGRVDPVILPRSSPALHLLERTRDEAHRFAITYHRSLRSARTLRSRLEEIPGIGEKRRKALLKAYPLPELLKEASIEDLAAVPGMNQKAAMAVYEAIRQEKKEQTVSPEEE